ncbi:MAG: ImmA/IrrE family metallo-endopeptidase [Bdellovibrionales bacterium]|nr:ImmA/IrrE family metallo-endopeptidase [Bdellovibrionales bacterium]
MDFSLISVPVVRGMSHAQIEKEASEFLQLVAPECLSDPRPTPMLEIFENKMDLLGFRVVVGKNVKGLGGVTDVTNRFIEIPLATYNQLEKGVPRARFTIAHECGHAKIHGKQAQMGTFASSENIQFARRSELRPFEDPEWQADTFAAAVLMPWQTMRMLYERGEMNVQTVMSVFQVSQAAASRRVMRLQASFEK